MNLFHKSPDLSSKIRIITVNHPDKEIRDKITNWLYTQGDVAGNEDVLIGEPFSDAFGKSEIIALEIYLGKCFDEWVNISLPKDLIFIEE